LDGGLFLGLFLLTLYHPFMATPFHAYAATTPGAPLVPFPFDPGPLRPEQVEVEVIACGICHSDLHMLQNDWGITKWPFVPGHEAVGRIVAVGDQVKGRAVGQVVGIGWYTGSCQHCRQCVGGDQHLCGSPEQTIVGRHGGFADRVRVDWLWAIPLPDGLDPRTAGPFLCGGITVFSPLVHRNIRPTDRVGVVGIGGLGHMGVLFANKWGCEVTAFSGTPAKKDEILRLGAHHVVDSKDPKAIRKLAGTLDLILVTVNAAIDWESYLRALAPKGRLHVVGAIADPIPLKTGMLLGGQKSISASPTGSPRVMAQMLDFAARHKLAPVTEAFPMSRVNEALKHLSDGKARYRVVLTA
jgi:uncharacterized zinc-type alcohol dehydrogenase-like protein